MESIGLQRLFNQHTGGNRFNTPAEVVAWMGVIQAQDLNSAKWAIGIRIPNSTGKTIDEAINNGEIIRTHLLRPTWHFVSAADYHSFLALSAPNINSSLKYRRIQLKLDEKIFAISNPALNEMLKNGNHLTREQITTEMAKLIPDLDSSKMNHILMEAEMNSLICSGRIINKQPTYALVNERIGNFDRTANFDRDNTLRVLADKYFKSHGPATLADFIWWSGLSAGDCRKALDMVKDELVSEKVENSVYWYNKTEISYSGVPELAFLPAFDEFIIAYKDRSAVINYEGHSRAVSSNGIFRPVVVYEGQVLGLWNKAIKKDTLQISIEWFIKPNKSIHTKVERAAGDYAKFLGLNNTQIL
jgi:hypothetical protein